EVDRLGKRSAARRDVVPVHEFATQLREEADGIELVWDGCLDLARRQAVCADHDFDRDTHPLTNIGRQLTQRLERIVRVDQARAVGRDQGGERRLNVRYASGQGFSALGLQLSDAPL